MSEKPSKEELEELIITDIIGPTGIARKYKVTIKRAAKWIKDYNIDLNLKYKGFIGKKFGKLTVISTIPANKNLGIKTMRCVCQCECGDYVEVTYSNIKDDKNHCCGKWSCFISDRSSAFISKYILLGHWNKIQNTNNNRTTPKEFSLNPEDLDYLWELQNGKCALSGVDIYLPNTASDIQNSNYTASLDRIDSKLGYIKSNVQWIHKEINSIKWHFNEDILIDFCRKIYNESKVF